MGPEVWRPRPRGATPKSVTPLHLYDLRTEFGGPSPELGGYQRRRLEEITEYTIHHLGGDNYLNDVTWEETLQAVWDWQVGHNGWPGVAYAFIVRPDMEEIAWVGSFDTIRYHAGGAKHPVYGVGVNNVNGLAICIAGKYMGKDPDAKTLARVNRLIAFIEPLLPAQPRRIVGHQEVSATDCPGDGFLPRWKGDLHT